MVMVMVMNDLLPPPLYNVNRPSHSRIRLFQNLTMKIHGQGHVCGQRSRSRLTYKIQRSRLWWRTNLWGMEFNRYVCFSFHGNRTTFGWDIGNSIFDLGNSRSWSRSRSNSIVTYEALEFNWYIILLFVSWQSDRFFWLRYSKFYIWPWKFKVKVMAKVKLDGHIWALEFNRYVSFRFVAIGPFLAEI